MTATPGWLKILLVASLSCNLALVGLFAGALIGKASEDDDQARRLPFLLRILPESRHEEAVALMAKTDASRAPMRDALDDGQAALLASMRAEPFDQAALENAFAAMNALTLERRAVTQSQIAAIAARMSAAERVEMADRMAAMFERWAERRRQREAARKTATAGQ